MWTQNIKEYDIAYDVNVQIFLKGNIWGVKELLYRVHFQLLDPKIPYRWANAPFGIQIEVKLWHPGSVKGQMDINCWSSLAPLCKPHCTYYPAWLCFFRQEHKMKMHVGTEHLSMLQMTELAGMTGKYWLWTLRRTWCVNPQVEHNWSSLVGWDGRENIPNLYPNSQCISHGLFRSSLSITHTLLPDRSIWFCSFVCFAENE